MFFRSFFLPFCFEYFQLCFVYVDILAFFPDILLVLLFLNLFFLIFQFNTVFIFIIISLFLHYLFYILPFNLLPILFKIPFFTSFLLLLFSSLSLHLLTVLSLSFKLDLSFENFFIFVLFAATFFVITQTI